MQKTNQSQVYLEDSRVRINCSISSQTSQDSQHAVLWYVRRATGSEADELLLRIERSGAFEYGAYAEEERLRRRVQAERLSPRLYVLTLNRAENSDSGTYYCLVEEWLSDPDGAWYRLSRESSGLTQVLVRQPGEQRYVSLFPPAAFSLTCSDQLRVVNPAPILNHLPPLTPALGRDQMAISGLKQCQRVTLEFTAWLTRTHLHHSSKASKALTAVISHLNTVDLNKLNFISFSLLC